MNFNAFWEKHKKFLTPVFGGLAVFLIGISWSFSSLATDGENREKLLQKNDELQSSIDRMLNYGRALDDREKNEKRLEDIIARLSISRNFNDSREETSKIFTPVEFKKRKASIYDRFHTKALREGLRLPTLDSIRFGANSDFGDQEWRDCYLQLEVLKRFLTVAVDLRLNMIESINPEAVRFDEITGSPEVGVLSHPVRFVCHGSYAALLQLISSFQSDNKFLKLEVEHMGVSKAAANLRSLTVVASGIEYGKPRANRQRSSNSSRNRGGRRR